MADLNINVVSYYQSGFLLEFPSATLFFDFKEGDLPPIRADKPLYVFISHVHEDHFKQDIFDLKNQYPKTEFFLGYDRTDSGVNDWLDRQSSAVQDSLSCFSGEQKLYSDDGKVLIRTFTSTDLGVAFLVEIEGKKIYHAGDLFLMKCQTKEQYMQLYTMALMSGKVMESYEQSLAEADEEFIRLTEPLRGMSVDYGMIPLDPRVSGTAYETVKRYMEVMSFKAWSPMHLWRKYEFVDKFLDEHPEYAANMVAITENQKVKKQIQLGKKFSLDLLDVSAVKKSSQTANDIGFKIDSDVAIKGAKEAGKRVIAKPGDILVLRLKYKNTGHPVQKAIICYDKFPAGLEYIKGSSSFKTSFNGDKVYNVSDKLLDIGLNMGDYRQGDGMILSYMVRVIDDKSIFKEGDTVLYNDASIATANGTGNVKVEIVVRR